MPTTMNVANSNGPVESDHWLICVAGSSPAVVTETLYCLKDRENFPNKVVIFTTLHGKGQIEKQGLKQQVSNLCRDYNLPVISGAKIEVRIVTNSAGVELEDIRTSEHQEAMADFLTRQIREITHPRGKGKKRPDSIHASLAGGRKSMSFYMGNIFSFFASANDELSHVLVEPGYEVPGFWYPKPEPFNITVKSYATGDVTGVLDASKAEIELSTIPFVQLSNALVSTDSDAFHNLSYQQLVDIYQVTLDPSRIKLTFNIKNLSVDLNGRVLPIRNFDSYLLYYLVARDSHENSFSYQKEVFGNKEHALTQALWQLMGEVTGIRDFESLIGNSWEAPAEYVEKYIARLKQENPDLIPLHQSPKLFSSLSKDGVISEKSIERMMTDIRKALEQTEGRPTVNVCKVATLKEDGEERKAAKGVDAYLGLLLPAHQIQLI
ncbi:CRISPR-associated ring nuclease Csm6 [Marinobacterium iners]|uniref:CRISPR-associated ring nuclease Csm6 n=1 Tax=Marinobacterium iners TaxID=48076 RepID=UPI001A8E4FFA|nr:CRISPR-associated ring nuclease Csm6 [Marinobacterium iners]